MATGVDRALEDLLEHLRSRFYGKYRGVVQEVEAATCRIKAMVPAVYGGAESGWCLPCVPYAGPGVGIAFLPEVGSAVWIEFEGGDVSFPIWTGCFWRDGEVPSDVDDDVKVIVTASQFEIKIDDDQESVTISDSNGNTLTLDSDGISLANGDQEVAISTESVSVNDGALEVQ
jgi:uncharacterized protein involved in type VI secretion and phage assembly